MALLEIKLFGCPTLRRKTEPVPEVSAEVKTLTDNMYETMYEAEGIGLAAPQVGVLQQVLVMDVTRERSHGREPCRTGEDSGRRGPPFGPVVGASTRSRVFAA